MVVCATLIQKGKTFLELSYKKKILLGIKLQSNFN
jgi:hypothetical protein